MDCCLLAPLSLVPTLHDGVDDLHASSRRPLSQPDASCCACNSAICSWNSSARLFSARSCASKLDLVCFSSSTASHKPLLTASSEVWRGPFRTSRSACVELYAESLDDCSVS